MTDTLEHEIRHEDAAGSGGEPEAISTATARTFAILDLVARSNAAIEVADVIEELALPKATAYRLVDGLVSSGYLAREPQRKRLIVGTRLTDLAFGAMRASMRDCGRHALLRRLAHQVNETCNIGVILNGEIVYLDRVESEHWPLRLHFAAGSRVPLHCSAIGKLYLALLPARRRHRLLQSLELRRFTDATITERSRLEAELKQIRKEQVSFDREEYLDGVVCVAAPVMGRNGEMLAAIAIQAPEARMAVAKAHEYLPALRSAATELAGTFQDRT
ncbi:MAG TPA: IclR family transcriptional regulator [Xanthobacteraceae bacterium]|jgi:DNA-binding IclR family transcriptional regulator|nr:IclR family transcriptional regulator [Xanthobacteraceae bacterium]